MRSTRIHAYLICFALAFVAEVLILSELDFLQPTPDFLHSRNLNEVQEPRQQEINHETLPLVPSVPVVMDGLKERISETKQAAPYARPFGTTRTVDTKAIRHEILPLVPSVSVTMDGLKEQISETKQAAPRDRPFGTTHPVDTKANASQLQVSDYFRPGRHRNSNHERKHTSSQHSWLESLPTGRECPGCTLRGLKQPRQRPIPPVMVDLPPTNQTVVDDRIIYYLHIHKSAGTAMCRAAEYNALDVSKTNCNVQADQRCCGEDDSLEAQQDFALSTDYQLVANEKDMYEAMDTEYYRYVVMLRDSRARYKSHWKNMYRRNNEKDTVENFTEWWTGQPDNWNVRKICGTPCMNTPKYGLTEHLWNQTVERLSQFDDILFVDRFNETFTKFASRVGWTRMPVLQSIARHVDYPSSSDEWDPMMTALDDALYEFAEGLYEGIPHPYAALSTERRAALREYFAREQECNSPCCATTCSTY
jgi:hypothetical protein